jgi:hypothetical protein
MPKREILVLLACITIGAIIGASFVAALYKILITLGVFVDYDR